MSNRFWEGYICPARIFGNLYFVGTRPASTHVIDTGEGLILIDAGFPEALSQILENIRYLDFDPRDVNIILISHGHYDHAGAAKELAELSGAEIYIGADDAAMVTGEVDDSLADYFGTKYTQFFNPDRLLRDGDTVTLGNTEIQCVATPGHTNGTFSFFFNVTDGENTYRAGMFGGVGMNTLNRKFLLSRGKFLENRRMFFESVRRLKKEKVDIFLGNHVGDNGTEEKLMKVKRGESDAFIAPNEWNEFLGKREERLRNLIKEEEEIMQTTIEKIISEKIIMIVRGVDDDHIYDLAEAMWRGGVRLMECTYDATGKIKDEEIACRIERLTKRFECRMLIGAGTVLTKKQVELTAAAGGKFVISPDTNPEIIAETKKFGLVSIPGALTPSEAVQAHNAGADFVKLFPINQFGIDYLKAISAPLSHIRFLAVGGVRAGAVASYINGGACGVGIGLSQEDRKAIIEGNYGYIEEKCYGLTMELK